MIAMHGVCAHLSIGFADGRRSMRPGAILVDVDVASFVRMTVESMFEVFAKRKVSVVIKQRELHLFES